MRMYTLQVALAASLLVLSYGAGLRTLAQPPAPVQFVHGGGEGSSAPPGAAKRIAVAAPAPGAHAPSPGGHSPGAPGAPGSPGAPSAPGGPGGPAAAPTAVAFAPNFALDMTVPQRWAPRISSISPLSASFCGGTKVTIRGTDFSPLPQDNKVFLGILECPLVAVSKTELQCVVPRHLENTAAPGQSILAPLKVLVKGTPADAAVGAMFTFSFDATPAIQGFGPTASQGGELVTFEGQNFGNAPSVSIGGKACEVRQVTDTFLQCVPEPDVAGIVDIEIYTGPIHGYACQAPKSPPLKFIHLLTIQSVQPANWGAEASGPIDGHGDGSLTVVGQGLSDSVVLKLCGDAATCEPTSGVQADKPEFHEGDNTFQTLTCKPSALQFVTPLLTENRTCELIAEAAGGMLTSVVRNAWTYVSTAASSPQPSMPVAQNPWQDIHAVGRGAVTMHAAERSLPSSAVVTPTLKLPAKPLGSSVSASSSKKGVARKGGASAKTKVT